MNQLERVEELKIEASRSLQTHLEESKINWISGMELIELTEECAIEFMARDPRTGNFQPLLYSNEVFANFLNNETYYYDKFARIPK